VCDVDQQLPLGHLDPLVQGVHGVILGYRHRRLGQDDAGVDPGVDQEHRRPADLDPVRQRLARAVYPGEGRQQRGVGVDRPAAEGVEELGADQLQEARADHQVRGVRSHLLGQGAVPVGPVRVVGDGLDESRNPGRLSPGEAGHPGSVRAHRHHLHPVSG
jgi:hypothetical protein